MCIYFCIIVLLPTLYACAGLVLCNFSYIILHTYIHKILLENNNTDNVEKTFYVGASQFFRYVVSHLIHIKKLTLPKL